MPADRLRVLVVPSWYPTASWPVNGVFVEDQVRGLATRHDVAVLAPHLASWWRNPGLLLRSRTESVASGGARVDHVRVLHPVPRWQAALNWRYWRTTRRAFLRLRERWGVPDLIHAHVVLPAGLAAVRLGEEFGIPVVLTEHSEPFEVHLQTPAQQARVRRALLGAAQVIAVSPSLAARVQRFCPEVRCTVIGNMIDTTFFAPAQPDLQRDHAAPVEFLTVAILEDRKGVHLLIEAVARLVERGITNLRLTIGGDGPERRQLEELAAARGVADRTRFLGALGRQEVRNAMQRADVFVLASRGETFGMVVAEAMACGTPVLATRCGGPEFVVTPDAGVLVPVGDVESLVDAMARFADGRLHFPPAAVRASIVARFSRDAFLDGMDAVYDAAMGGSARRTSRCITPDPRVAPSAP